MWLLKTKMAQRESDWECVYFFHIIPATTDLKRKSQQSKSTEFGETEH